MSDAAEPIDPAIEAVARAICAAAGDDPDEQLQTNERQAVRHGNTISSEFVTVPAWRRHVAEAKRFSAAYAALRALERRK